MFSLTDNLRPLSPANGRGSNLRAAFTLVELLMVIMLIGILSTFVLVTMAHVNETAREDRTKAQLMRIHEQGRTI